MPHSSPDEYVSVAFAGVARPPLWFYATWQPIARSFDPLIAALDVKGAVRTTQSQDGTQIRLGRLGWGAPSDRKWTHDSPDTAGRSASWRFMAGEAWWPSWTQCQRSGVNPSLFLSFTNPFILGAPAEGQFNQFFHVALPTALFRRHFDAVSPAIDTVRRQLQATDCVMRVTPWNLNYDSVQDTLGNHMQYRDSTNDMRFDVTRTNVQWAAYDPEAILLA